MNTSAGTNPVKVIVQRADHPEQMAKVVDCVHAGHPVTIYANSLTPEIERFAGLSFVQVRIGQEMNCKIVDDGSIIVFP